MSEETFCYVAADPEQPGAAWAAIVILDNQKDLSKFCAKEIKSGANIERVTVERAREMLCAWERPEKVNV